MSNIIHEGIFDKSADHNVNDSFYSMCTKMIDSIYQNFENTGYAGIINRNKTLKDSKSFQKSIEKAKDKIKKCKAKNINKINLSINVMNSNMRSNDAMKCVGNALNGFGFEYSKKFDNVIKNMFVGQTLYRVENDGTYTILNYSVTYTTQYYVETNLNNINIKITNLPNNDATKKKLNLENYILVTEDCNFDMRAIVDFLDEAVEEDAGIFSECVFLEGNDINAAMKELEYSKKRFHSNHAARMEELNKALNRLKENNKNDNSDKDHAEMTRKLDQTQKRLEDLLKR